MKKNLFLASALVMGMMSSCSNDVENVTVPNQDLQAVVLNVGSPSVVVTPSTKGIGTVGSTDLDENNWKGENLYLNMMCISENGAPAWKLSTWTKITDLAAGTSQEITNFDNVKVQAPTGVNQGALVITPNAEGRYYPPTNSRHQFFAYHIDDAAADDTYQTVGGEPTVVNENQTLTTHFKIDGSQDLMVGKATPSKAGFETSIFSAKSARGGVIPQLQMKHLLTRFTFEVKSNKNDNSMQVTKIAVKSKNTGKMIVAYADESAEANLLTFEDAEAELELQQKGAASMEPLTAVTLTNAYKKIGESLMVAPGSDEYEIIVTVSQNVGAGQPAEYENVDLIKVPGTALAGTSYNVQITVYGLEEIEVQASLAPWENGGPIVIDPDKEDAGN